MARTRKKPDGFKGYKNGKLTHDFDGQKIFMALVIKENLDLPDNQRIHDYKFVWASDHKEAQTTLQNANWSEFGWKPGKSRCLLLKLDSIFSEEFYEVCAHYDLDVRDMLSWSGKAMLPKEQVDGPAVVEERPKGRVRKKADAAPKRRRRRVA